MNDPRHMRLYSIVGGNERLIVELARRIDADIRLNHRVAAIEARTDGRVDLLINNVGNYNPQHVTRLDPAVWDATIASNLSGAFYCCHHALKLMGADGQIINIGMAGLEGIRANRRGADYYVSKTGLLVLTRSLAAAYAVRRIRVNMVSPGQLDNSIDLPPPDPAALGPARGERRGGVALGTPVPGRRRAPPATGHHS